MENYYFVETVVGSLTIIEREEHISAIHFGKVEMHGMDFRKTEVIARAEHQINAYYNGQRDAFDLPILIEGTEFQKKVWKALMEIPKGETRSYKDIAIAVGNPNASRAVGNANNRNLIPIIIPCHRVIGKNGKLVGFAGGLDLKQTLLDVEKRL